MAKNVKKEDETNQPSFLFSAAVVNLKILFVDVLISVSRLISEFGNGYALLLTNDTREYGFISFGISMLPGFIAAIHVLTHYRMKWNFQKTIIAAFCAICFYPLIPTLTLLHLLWMTPSDNQPTPEYEKAKYLVTVAQAIHGCIASPLQVGYQVSLVYRGINVLSNASESRQLVLIDLEGNSLAIEYAAPLVIFFSIIT